MPPKNLKFKKSSKKPCKPMNNGIQIEFFFLIDKKRHHDNKNSFNFSSETLL